jgi:hypothetical protein
MESKHALWSGRWISVGLPLLLGAIAFWAFTGGAILDPANLPWLMNQGDSAQHYTGWQFLRQQPVLQWPLGKTPAFGETLGSSIVFTDTVPLMALLLHPFSALLPADFQYYGLWILLCFMLQALFGWRILARFTTDRALLAVGTAFFALSPVMLFRLLGHEALVGQWVLLAAIDLCLQERRTTGRWALLLGITCLIHAYLVAMVAALWAVDVLRRLLQRRMSVWAAMGEGAAVAAAVLLAVWGAGYLFPGSSQGTGFGVYRFNLLAPVAPFGIFSAIVPLSLPDGDYEGFAYLGLGMLLLLPFSAAALLWRGGIRPPTQPRWLPLVLAALCLLVYAVSNRIAWGTTELWEYEVPALLVPLTSTFRASGRFAWPAVYLLQVIALGAVCARYPRRVALPVVALCLLVQCVELVAPARYLRERWSEAWSSPFVSRFWQDMDGRYRRIAYAVPHSEGDSQLALLAARRGMSINSGYLARIDGNRLQALRVAMAQEVGGGRFRDDTLYVFENEALLQQAAAAAGPGALAVSVDRYHVLAPDWCRGTVPCNLPAYRQQLLAAEPFTVMFGAGGNAGPYQVAGWDAPQPSGTWSEGTVARLRLPVQATGTQDQALRLHFNALVVGRSRQQRITVLANGESVAQWTFGASRGSVREVRVPASLLERHPRTIDLELRLPDATSPRDAGIGPGDKAQAVFMQSIDILPPR